MKQSQIFSMTTRSLADGSEACYVVYYERELVATFPINNPSRKDAALYARTFIDAMNASLPETHVSIHKDKPQPQPTCDMVEGCDKPVTHIKGTK